MCDLMKEVEDEEEAKTVETLDLANNIPKECYNQFTDSDDEPKYSETDDEENTDEEEREIKTEEENIKETKNEKGNETEEPQKVKIITVNSI